MCDGNCGCGGDAAWEAQAADSHIEELEKQLKNPQAFLMADKKPEKEGDVIIWLDPAENYDGDPQIATAIKNENNGKWYFLLRRTDVSEDEVLYWFPVPKTGV